MSHFCFLFGRVNHWFLKIYFRTQRSSHMTERVYENSFVSDFVWKTLVFRRMWLGAYCRRRPCFRCGLKEWLDHILLAWFLRFTLVIIASDSMQEAIVRVVDIYKSMVLSLGDQLIVISSSRSGCLQNPTIYHRPTMLSGSPWYGHRTCLMTSLRQEKLQY